MFFKQRFLKCLDQLKVFRYAQQFPDIDLIALMHESRGRDATPQEAAVRAYCKLVLENSSIPLYERLKDSFETLETEIGGWQFDRKLNADLVRNVYVARNALLRSFVGDRYEDAYYRCLNTLGLVVPIKHSLLGYFARINLLLRSAEGCGPAYAAINLITVFNWSEWSRCGALMFDVENGASLFGKEPMGDFAIFEMALGLSIRALDMWVRDDMDLLKRPLDSSTEQCAEDHRATHFVSIDEMYRASSCIVKLAENFGKVLKVLSAQRRIAP